MSPPRHPLGARPSEAAIAVFDEFVTRLRGAAAGAAADGVKWVTPARERARRSARAAGRRARRARVATRRAAR